MTKISDLPIAPTLSLTDEAAYNQSGVTRRGQISKLPAAIQGSIDHTALLNVGTNSHAVIDAHIANLSNPHVVNKTQVGLSNVENLKVNLTATVAPTVGNDDTEGYAIGSRWIDTVADVEYVAFDVTTGAAVWESTTKIDIAGLSTQSPIQATDEAIISDAGTNKKFPLSVLAAFVEPDLDHTGMLNIGTNTHTQIDTHIAHVSNPHTVTKGQVGLGNVENSKVNFTAVVDPTAGDDNTAGYSVGSQWINTANDKAYTCVDSSTAAAVWVWTNSVAQANIIVSPGNDISSTYSPYSSAAASTNGQANYAFHVPDDFVTLISVHAYAIPASTASGLNIDIVANWGTAGELFNANTASDTSSTYSVVASTIYQFDVTSLLTGVSPDDSVGLEFNHNSVGQTIDYLPLHFNYSRT
jgi:hypothetical protein